MSDCSMRMKPSSQSNMHLTTRPTRLFRHQDAPIRTLVDIYGPDLEQILGRILSRIVEPSGRSNPVKAQNPSSSTARFRAPFFSGDTIFLGPSPIQLRPGLSARRPSQMACAWPAPCVHAPAATVRCDGNSVPGQCKVRVLLIDGSGCVLIRDRPISSTVFKVLPAPWKLSGCEAASHTAHSLRQGTPLQ